MNQRLARYEVDEVALDILIMDQNGKPRHPSVFVVTNTETRLPVTDMRATK